MSPQVPDVFILSPPPAISGPTAPSPCWDSRRLVSSSWGARVAHSPPPPRVLIPFTISTVLSPPCCSTALGSLSSPRDPVGSGAADTGTQGGIQGPFQPSCPPPSCSRPLPHYQEELASLLWVAGNSPSLSTACNKISMLWVLQALVPWNPGEISLSLSPSPSPSPSPSSHKSLSGSGTKARKPWLLPPSQLKWYLELKCLTLIALLMCRLHPLPKVREATDT